MNGTGSPRRGATRLALLGGIAALLGTAAHAQEVGTFIDLSRTKDAPVTMSPDDLEFLKDFARGMDVPIDEKGRIPKCQWRSPLKTPGAYVDASNYGDHGWQFYVRAPFPKRRTTLQGLTLSGRPEFPKVAFLEFMGTFDEATWTPRWDFARIVLPPLTIPGMRFNQFSLARLVAGGVEARQPEVLAGPPGLPTRLDVELSFGAVLAALEKDGTLSIDVGRLATSEALPPRFRAEADFSALPADLKRISERVRDMKRRDAANECLVFSEDCLDGQCG